MLVLKYGRLHFRMKGPDCTYVPGPVVRTENNGPIAFRRVLLRLNGIRGSLFRHACIHNDPDIRMGDTPYPAAGKGVAGSPPGNNPG